MEREDLMRHLAGWRYGVDPATGLSPEEADRRLAEFGPNALRSRKPVPLWQRILVQFQDPLVYLLLVGALVAGGAWVATLTNPGSPETSCLLDTAWLPTS